MDYKIIKVNNDVKFKVRSQYVIIPDSYIIEEIWSEKQYIKNGFNIKPKSTVVDLGAHIGIFTAFASKLAYNGRVFSFEPNKENFYLLNENIRLNKLNNVTSGRLGVLGKKQMRKLYIDSENCAGHSFYKKTGKYEIIECVSLKDIFKSNNIRRCDFLKIDCEGAEYDILLNTPKIIFGLISKIVLEWHETGNPEYKIDLLEIFLLKLGFKVDKLLISRGVSRGILYAKK